MSEFKYAIGDKIYLQRPLVMGQAEQLMDILEGMEMPKKFSSAALKKVLGEKLYLAMAIALVEEGKSPKRTEEELATLADEIHWTINPDTTIKVIDDFFDCNPAASILQKLTGMAKRLSDKMSEVTSRTPSSFSQKGTLQKETKSSGDMVLKNASPSPDTAPGS